MRHIIAIEGPARTGLWRLIMLVDITFLTRGFTSGTAVDAADGTLNGPRIRWLTMWSFEVLAGEEEVAYCERNCGRLSQPESALISRLEFNFLKPLLSLQRPLFVGHCVSNFLISIRRVEIKWFKILIVNRRSLIIRPKKRHTSFFS